MGVIKDVFSGFFTTMKGMVVTGKELFVPAVTVQYPTEKRQMPERFRGMVVNDKDTCIACNKCVKICPVDCIECVGEGKGKERHPVVFTIDYIKCCWCELCCDVCPVDSIFMSDEHEIVYRDRSQMIRDFCLDPIPVRGGQRKPEEKKEETKDAKESKNIKESKPAEDSKSAE